MKFEERLSDALRAAVEAYNECGDPDKAVVKAAEAGGFNKDQTDRLVEKFNTAKTVSFFESHPDDRTATFKLASKEKVAEMLFMGDGEEKTASAPEFHDYSFYNSSVDGWRTVQDRGELEKEASAHDESEASGYSLDVLHRESGVYLEKYASSIEELESAAGMVGCVVEDEVEKLASSLASSQEAYCAFRSMAGRMRGMGPVMEAVDRLVPDYVKEASSSQANVVDTSIIKDDLDRACWIVGALDKVAAARKAADGLAAKRERLMSELSRIDGSRKEAQASDGKGGGKGDKKDKGGIGGDIASYLAGSIVPVSPKGITDFLSNAGLGSENDIFKALYGNSDKRKEVLEHIDNVRRSDILTDLYANDPILSEHDPDEVSNAYQTLVEIAPDMSLNKEVSRSVLRQMVAAQAVSPFDAKQWLDYDIASRNRNRVGAPKPQPVV